MKSESKSVWIGVLSVVVLLSLGFNLYQFNNPKVVETTTELSQADKLKIETTAVEKFQTANVGLIFTKETLETFVKTTGEDAVKAYQKEIDDKAKAETAKALTEKTEYEKVVVVTTSTLELTVEPGGFVKFFGPQLTVVGTDFKISKINTNAYLLGGRLGGTFKLENLVPNQTAYRKYRDTNVFDKVDFFKNETFKVTVKIDQKDKEVTLKELYGINRADGEIVIIVEYNYCEKTQYISFSDGTKPPPAPPAPPKPPKDNDNGNNNGSGKGSGDKSGDKSGGDKSGDKSGGDKSGDKSGGDKSGDKPVVEIKKTSENFYQGSDGIWHMSLNNPSSLIDSTSLSRSDVYYHDTTTLDPITNIATVTVIVPSEGTWYLIVAGAYVDKTKGVLRGVGPGTYSYNIEDGFILLVRGRSAATEFDFRHKQADSHSWWHMAIDRGPIPN